MNIKEGYIDFKGYKTYYRIAGESTGGKLPLLALHGGPGCAHDYLESLDGIAENYGRAVVYYDQLGCGKSRIPESKPGFWCAELWEEEVDVVRKALGLDKIHLLGQSWGGMLAMQYLINRNPSGIASAIIASSPASIPLWVSEAQRLISFMPKEMQDALAQAAVDHDYSKPEVQAASAEYYRRHVCSLSPYPDHVSRSFDQMGESYTMTWGESEYVVTGNLKGWDYSGRLDEIKVPVLVTSGRADEATPAISKQLLDGIPDCRWELFPGTHLCHVENKEIYNQTAEKFMSEHE